MTIMEPPPLVQPVLDLLNCVCQYLEEQGSGPTCWCGWYSGATVSWEYCGECSADACGMGYVRLVTANPYEVFPAATIDIQCSKPLAYQLEVGVLRCFPTMEPGGDLPDANEITNASAALALDMHALHEAIKCCHTTDVALGAWTPFGPEGGCHGGAWTIWMDTLFHAVS